ncbi:MAG: nucleoside deaminase [Clostridia bacterium]|nr:nucleoside deaminase [Clostridia bacterium]
MDEQWMRVALEEAAQAAAEGEVPVGAVVVRGTELLSRAHNRCVNDNDATAHAETLAISEACKRVGSWRLSDCTLYVTLEPCPMCAGAAINARIPRIVYAAKDPRAGACESLFRLSSYPLECQPVCESGLLQEESLALLSTFFSALRKGRRRS